MANPQQQTPEAPQTETQPQYPEWVIAWDTIQKTPEFQQADDMEREAIRLDVFREYVAPNLSPYEVEEGLKQFNKKTAPTGDPTSGIAGDTAAAIKSGLWNVGGDIASAFTLGDPNAVSLEMKGRSEEAWNQASPSAIQEAAAFGIEHTDENGFSFKPGSTVYGGYLNTVKGGVSMVPMVAGGGMFGLAAKGISRVAGVTKATKAAVAAGNMAKAQAAMQTANNITKATQFAGQSALMGAMIGGGSSDQAFQEVYNQPEPVLEQSEIYQGYLQQGMSKAQARDTIARDAAKAAFGGGFTLGAFSGGVYGRFLDKMLRGTLGAGVKGTTRAGNVMRGGLGELGQETVESGGQQYLSNVAQAEVGLPVDPMKNVKGAAATGALLGFAMGGPMAGVRGGRAAPNLDSIGNEIKAAQATQTTLETELSGELTPEERTQKEAQLEKVYRNLLDMQKVHDDLTEKGLKPTPAATEEAEPLVSEANWVDPKIDDEIAQLTREIKQEKSILSRVMQNGGDMGDNWSMQRRIKQKEAMLKRYQFMTNNVDKQNYFDTKESFYNWVEASIGTPTEQAAARQELKQRQGTQSLGGDFVNNLEPELKLGMQEQLAREITETIPSWQQLRRETQEIKAEGLANRTREAARKKLDQRAAEKRQQEFEALKNPIEAGGHYQGNGQTVTIDEIATDPDTGLEMVQYTDQATGKSEWKRKDFFQNQFKPARETHEQTPVPTPQPVAEGAVPEAAPGQAVPTQEAEQETGGTAEAAVPAAKPPTRRIKRQITQKPRTQPAPPAKSTVFESTPERQRARLTYLAERLEAVGSPQTKSAAKLLRGARATMASHGNSTVTIGGNTLTIRSGRVDKAEFDRFTKAMARKAPRSRAQQTTTVTNAAARTIKTIRDRFANLTDAKSQQLFKLADHVIFVLEKRGVMTQKYGDNKVLHIEAGGKVAARDLRAFRQWLESEENTSTGYWQNTLQEIYDTLKAGPRNPQTIAAEVLIKAIRKKETRRIGYDYPDTKHVRLTDGDPDFTDIRTFVNWLNKTPAPPKVETRPPKKTGGRGSLAAELTRKQAEKERKIRKEQASRQQYADYFHRRARKAMANNHQAIITIGAITDSHQKDETTSRDSKRKAALGRVALNALRNGKTETIDYGNKQQLPIRVGKARTKALDEFIEYLSSKAEPTPPTTPTAEPEATFADDEATHIWTNPETGEKEPVIYEGNSDYGMDLYINEDGEEIIGRKSEFEPTGKVSTAQIAEEQARRQEAEIAEEERQALEKLKQKRLRKEQEEDARQQEREAEEAERKAKQQQEEDAREAELKRIADEEIEKGKAWTQARIEADKQALLEAEQKAAEQLNEAEAEPEKNPRITWKKSRLINEPLIGNREGKAFNREYQAKAGLAKAGLQDTHYIYKTLWSNFYIKKKPDLSDIEWDYLTYEVHGATETVMVPKNPISGEQKVQVREITGEKFIAYREWGFTTGGTNWDVKKGQPVIKLRKLNRERFLEVLASTKPPEAAPEPVKKTAKKPKAKSEPVAEPEKTEEPIPDNLMGSVEDTVSIPLIPGITEFSGGLKISTNRGQVTFSQHENTDRGHRGLGSFTKSWNELKNGITVDDLLKHLSLPGSMLEHGYAERMSALADQYNILLRSIQKKLTTGTEKPATTRGLETKIKNWFKKKGIAKPDLSKINYQMLPVLFYELGLHKPDMINQLEAYFNDLDPNVRFVAKDVRGGYAVFSSEYSKFNQAMKKAYGDEWNQEYDPTGVLKEERENLERKRQEKDNPEDYVIRESEFGGYSLVEKPKPEPEVSEEGKFKKIKTGAYELKTPNHTATVTSVKSMGGEGDQWSVTINDNQGRELYNDTADSFTKGKNLVRAYLKENVSTKPEKVSTSAEPVQETPESEHEIAGKESEATGIQDRTRNQLDKLIAHKIYNGNEQATLENKQDSLPAAIQHLIDNGFTEVTDPEPLATLSQHVEKSRRYGWPKETEKVVRVFTKGDLVIGQFEPSQHWTLFFGVGRPKEQPLVPETSGNLLTLEESDRLRKEQAKPTGEAALARTMSQTFRDLKVSQAFNSYFFEGKKGTLTLEHEGRTDHVNAVFYYRDRTRPTITFFLNDTPKTVSLIGRKDANGDYTKFSVLKENPPFRQNDENYEYIRTGPSNNGQITQPPETQGTAAGTTPETTETVKQPEAIAFDTTTGAVTKNGKIVKRNRKGDVQNTIREGIANGSLPGKLKDYQIERPEGKRFWRASYQPKPARSAFNYDNLIKIAADDISQLRKIDVYRIMENTPSEELRGIAAYITERRPDLQEEVDDVLAELEGTKPPETEPEPEPTSEPTPAPEPTPEPVAAKENDGEANAELLREDDHYKNIAYAYRRMVNRGPVTVTEIRKINKYFSGEGGLASLKNIVDANPGMAIADLIPVIIDTATNPEYGMHVTESGQIEEIDGEVIRDAMEDATSSPKFDDISEAKAWLIKEIDKAIKAAPQEAEPNNFIRFTVPGDGRFRVKNSKERLTFFKNQVKASGGFKKPSKPRGPQLAQPRKYDTVVMEFLKDGEFENAYWYAKNHDKLFFTKPKNSEFPELVVDTGKTIKVLGKTFTVARMADGDWIAVYPKGSLLVARGESERALNQRVAEIKGKHKDRFNDVIGNAMRQQGMTQAEAETQFKQHHKIDEYAEETEPTAPTIGLTTDTWEGIKVMTHPESDLVAFPSQTKDPRYKYRVYHKSQSKAEQKNPTVTSLSGAQELIRNNVREMRELSRGYQPEPAAPETTTEPTPQPDVIPETPPRKKRQLRRAKNLIEIDAKIEAAGEKLANVFRTAGSTPGMMGTNIIAAVLEHGVDVSILYLKKGAIKFADWADNMLGYLDSKGIEPDDVLPHLKKLYLASKAEVDDDTFEQMDSDRDVRAFDLESLFDEEAEAEPNVQRGNVDLERNRPDTTPETPLGTTGVQNEREGAGRPAGTAVGRNGETGSRTAGDTGVSESGALVSGTVSNTELLESDGTLGSAIGTADGGERRGGRDTGRTGTEPDTRSDQQIENAAAATGELTLEQKVELQKQAESIPGKAADLQNIRDTLPVLLSEQQEDVHKAEQRFFDNDKAGMLFTNGTGTGKTFTGLGVIKRFAREGKDNILIIAPSGKVASDWIASGVHLGLNISRLESTKDVGKGIVVTTYANAGDNAALVNRNWDLVVADESHKLMQGKQGEPTHALKAVRALTLNPRGVQRRYGMLHGDDIARHNELGQRIMDLESMARSDVTAEQRASYLAQAESLRPEYKALEKTLKQHLTSIKSQIENTAEKDRPKALFLSATPFAYHFSVDYGDGYLFDMTGGREEDTSSRGPRLRDRFYIENFGYRWRYSKLTEPDRDVDVGLMEREFNQKLKDSGALSGRKLEVDADYSREFILIEDAIGQKIDDGVELIRTDERLKHLYPMLEEQFKWLQQVQMLEAIKAKHAIDRVKQHQALGRKVVIFHNYNVGGTKNPFAFKTSPRNQKAVNDAIRLFNELRPDLANLELDLPSPIDTLKAAFPDLLLFNGKVKEADRLANVDAFNNDDNPNQVILIQRDAGKEGVSLQDTTGNYQRGLIDLGLPGKPTDLIQTEGRIYRVGQSSNAVIEYFNTGTSFEKHVFAITIASRASTAENLALGHEGRALLPALVEAFKDSTDHAPHKEQGKGGKEGDRNTSVASLFDKAKTYYFARMKRTAANKSAEGIDYFATPEPIGLKMFEMTGIQRGESLLEPSAGHGAIARFFPEFTRNTFVEPSYKLASDLGLSTQGKILIHNFEDLALINKYHGIAMNPPFGVGGKTAAEHVEKAMKHLRDGGRLVALIPTGPAADKRFEKLEDSDTAKDFYKVAEILMPPSTFERAGTKVMSKIVVWEKQTGENNPGKLQHQSHDFRDAKDIKELFSLMENLSLPDRLPPEPKKVKAVEGELIVTTPTGQQNRFYTMDSKHTQSGKDLFVVNMDGDLGDTYDQVNQLAKANNGYYIKARMRNWYKPADGSEIKGKPLFTFNSKEGRDQFLTELQATSAEPAAEITTPSEPETSNAVEGYSDQHPEWATTFEKDAVGGKIIYSEDDWALIEGYSTLSGEPVYPFISKEHGKSRVDITSFTGDILDADTRKRLEAARQRHIDREQAAFEANPEGPFTNNQRVVAGENISDDILNAAKSWLSMVGITDRVFISDTFTDPSKAAEQYHLYGPYAAIRHASDAESSEGGYIRTLPNGDHFIMLKVTGRSDEQVLTVLAHEIGHIIEKTAYKNASQETRNAIIDAFNEWIREHKPNIQQPGSAKALIESMRHPFTAEVSGVTETTKAADLNTNYWASFGEWFADNTARWALTSKKPKSVVEKFFKAVAEKLKTLYAALTGRRYLPNKVLADYLDNLTPADFTVDAAIESQREQEATPEVAYRLAEPNVKGIRPYLAKTLQRQLNKALGKIVTVVQSEANLPKHLRDQIASDNTSGQVKGIYDEQSGQTFVIADHSTSLDDAIRTALHEAVGHKGLRNVLGAALNNTLDNVFRSLTKPQQAALRKAYSSQLAGESTKNQQRIIAEEYLAHLAETNPNHRWFKTTLARLRSWLRKYLPQLKWSQNDMRQLIMDAKQSMVAAPAINTRNAQIRQKHIPRTGPAAVRYQLAKMPNLDKQSLDQLKDSAKKTGTTIKEFTRRSGLGFLGGKQITEMYSSIFDAVTEQFGHNPLERLDKLYQKMTSDRSNYAHDAELIDQSWSKLARAAPNTYNLLSNVMHTSTLIKQDPRLPFMELGDKTIATLQKIVNKATSERQRRTFQRQLDRELARKAQYDDLKKQWDALGKDSEAQKIYTKVEQFYRRQFKDTEAALIERIHGTELDSSAKTSAMTEIKLMFHEAINGPYFPLMRFGDYVITAKDAQGKPYRAHFETQVARDAARTDLEKAGYQIEFTGMRKNFDPTLLGGVGQFSGKIKALFEGDLGKKVPEDDYLAIMREINQITLDLLPEMSAGKRSMTRKGVAGYHENARRAFDATALTSANRIGKIRYGWQMEAEMAKMQEAASEEESTSPLTSSQRDIAAQVHLEMLKRHQLIMNPTGNQLAATLTNVGFIFYMGGSIGAGLVNLTQNLLIALPQMGAQYGFRKTAKVMGQVVADYFKHGGPMPKGLDNLLQNSWLSLERSKNLPADEVALIQQLINDGTIETTQAHTLAQMADTDIKPEDVRKKDWYTKVTRASGLFFHNAEVMNRQVAALTAYRLAKANSEITLEKGKPSEATVDKIRKAVFDAHYDYSGTNRPRNFKGNWAKVLLLFKQYSQNTTYFLARNFYQSLKGESKEVRDQARKTLTGTLAMHGVFAGAMGLPMMSTLFWIAGMAMGDEDDPFDAEYETRNLFADLFGKTAGHALSKGLINAFTGLDVHGRTGVHDLWIRSSNYDMSAREEAKNMVVNAAGPLAGLTVNTWAALDRFANGEHWQGLEGMMPKFIRDGMKTIRYNTEGVQNAQGKTLLNDFSPWESVWQAAGIGSARLSEVYDVNAAVTGSRTAIQRRRTLLMGQMDKAETQQERQQVQQQINAFNDVQRERNRDWAVIDPKDLMSSLKRRQQTREKSVSGVYLSDTMEGLREQGRFGAVTRF